MTSYTASEVIQFAISIEETGKDFYQTLGEQFSRHPGVASLFLDLARQEGDHKIFFQQMGERAKNWETDSPLTEEYFLYLRGFADHTIFDAKKSGPDLAHITDPAKAIEFSMGRELNAVNYYRELKQMVPEQEASFLDEIIAEEQSHFNQLQERLKQLNTSDQDNGEEFQ